MKKNTEQIEAFAYKLFETLEKDVQVMDMSLDKLRELRRLTVKRDEKALSELLEEIRLDSQVYLAQQYDRKKTREKLGILLGCKPEEVTLSKIKECLPEDKIEQLNGLRTTLRDSAQRLKVEYSVTSRLLSQCRRMNLNVLNSIFRNNSDTTTYDARGNRKTQGSAAFVNTKL